MLRSFVMIWKNNQGLRFAYTVDSCQGVISVKNARCSGGTRPLRTALSVGSRTGVKLALACKL